MAAWGKTHEFSTYNSDVCSLFGFMNIIEARTETIMRMLVRMRDHIKPKWINDGKLSPYTGVPKLASKLLTGYDILHPDDPENGFRSMSAKCLKLK